MVVLQLQLLFLLLNQQAREREGGRKEERSAGSLCRYWDCCCCYWCCVVLLQCCSAAVMSGYRYKEPRQVGGRWYGFSQSMEALRMVDETDRWVSPGSMDLMES